MCACACMCVCVCVYLLEKAMGLLYLRFHQVLLFKFIKCHVSKLVNFNCKKANPANYLITIILLFIIENTFNIKNIAIILFCHTCKSDNAKNGLKQISPQDILKLRLTNHQKIQFTDNTPRHDTGSIKNSS